MNSASSDRRRHEQADDPPGRPALLVPLDQREDQAEEAAGQRHEADRIEPAVLGVARLVQLLRRQDDRGNADRDVDEEDPPPREPGGERAARQRADRDRRADRRAPDAERGAALPAVELLREQGEGGREHHRPAEPLDAARDDQEERVVGEAAGGGGEVKSVTPSRKSRLRPKRSASDPAVRTQVASARA